MSVEFSAWKQEYTLLLKGQMTHRATLGTDPRGNLTRIDNALAQMPQRLEAAKAQLDNLYQQQAAAKEEVGKPFLYEEELKSKNARLVELDTLLKPVWWSWIPCSKSTERDRHTMKLSLPKAHGLRY